MDTFRKYKSGLTFGFILLMVLSLPKISIAEIQKENATMDLVIDYDKTNDSAIIKWYPAFHLQN